MWAAATRVTKRKARGDAAAASGLREGEGRARLSLVGFMVLHLHLVCDEAENVSDFWLWR